MIILSKMKNRVTSFCHLPFLKKLLMVSAFWLLIFPLSLQAQSVYQSSDLLTAPDSLIYSQASPLDLILNNFAATGANTNWNFGNMTAASQDYLDFLDPGSTGYQASFIAGCIFDCISSGGNPFVCPFSCAAAWNDLDIAIPGLDSINLGILALTNVLAFYDNTGSTFQQEALGYSVEVGGLAIPLINSLNAPDVVFDFPLQFGNVDSSESGFDIDLTAVGIPLIYIHHQKRINEVEGWGVLETPYGIFNNTLKVKSTIHNSDTLIFQGDTLTLGTFLPPNLAPDTEVEYKWLDPAHGWPVLTASGFELLGITTITRVEYLDSIRCFDPAPFFVYFPIPTYIDSATGQVDVNFFNLSTNSDTYSWDFGDGGSSTSQNPVHTYSDDGIFFVTLTACNTWCQPPVCDSISLPILIIDTNAVVANFLAIPATACTGQTISFTNLSFRDSTWFWDFGDGTSSTQQNPSHAYTAAGTYNVMLIASNSLDSDTAFQTVTVGAPINGNFIWLDSISNVPIQFMNTSTGTNPNTTFLWTFLGAGASPASSTDENPVITFNSTGTVFVCMTAINGLGCSDVICQTVNIQSCLDADFSTGGLFNNICPGTTVQLNNNSTGINPISYTWLVDGAFYSQATDTSIVFNSGGSFTITLIGSNSGCSDTTSQTLTVVPPVNAGADQTICLGDNVGLSVSGGGPLALYNWSPGAGLSCTICSNPTASPAATTTYTVSTINALCGITAIPVSGTTSVQFSNNSANATTYLWDFGDGNTSTQAAITHTYAIPDTFTVCLTASNSCFTDSACQTIITDCPQPVADFGFSASGLSVSFTDSSYNFVTSLLWDFGDGNTSSSPMPVHTYAAPGTYTVCLFISGICGGDMICEQITVSCAPPEAGFTFTNTGLSFSFTDTTSGNLFAWAWSFGDGSGSTQQNPVHTYSQPGTYTVCLTVVSNCGSDSSCKLIQLPLTPIDPEADPFDIRVLPNPAFDQAFLELSLEYAELVEISILDMTGRSVLPLLKEWKGPGRHRIGLPSRLAPGVYLVRVGVGNARFVRKLIVAN
jgi:PKD repeat protein